MQEAVLIAFVILTFLTVIVRRGSRGDLQQEVVTSQEFSRCSLHCHIVMVSCAVLQPAEDLLLGVPAGRVLGLAEGALHLPAVLLARTLGLHHRAALRHGVRLQRGVRGSHRARRGHLWPEVSVGVGSVMR